MISCDEYHNNYEPISPTEQAAIIAYEQTILKDYIPSTISGDDQDFEDVIEAVHKNALQNCCALKRWHYKNGKLVEITMLPTIK